MAVAMGAEGFASASICGILDIFGTIAAATSQVNSCANGKIRANRAPVPGFRQPDREDRY